MYDPEKIFFRDHIASLYPEESVTLWNLISEMETRG